MLKHFIPVFPSEVRNWSFEARMLQWLTFFWLLVGLVTLFSASYPEGVAEHNDGWYIIKRQMLWVIVGSIGFNFIVRSPLESIARQAYLFFFPLLILIFLTSLIGVNVGGAERWIKIGPLALQPSELIKPFLVLQSARFFAKWDKLPWPTRLGWLLIFALLLIGILIQPNLSTTSLCGMTLWLIAVAAELPWFSLLLTAFSGLGLAAVSLNFNAYQRDRIIFFLDPWSDAQGKGYQLIQSLLAIGSGGFWGTGYGLSYQKLSYLPIRSTDFIFAVFAEEFGFIGGLVLLLILLTYALLALRVGMKCNSKIHRLVAIGVMVVMVGQSLLNIGVATGSLPTTGLPLPLFSYGGSSMIASLLLAGLLIRVARESSKADVLYFQRK